MGKVLRLVEEHVGLLQGVLLTLFLISGTQFFVQFGALAAQLFY